MPANENRAEQRKRRQPKPQPKNTAPEVVYTAPVPFNRSRLVVRLLTILAVVIAIGMGLSIFFKVQTVTVVGAQTYSAWSVSEASGIQQGDSLLFFGKAGAAGRIRQQLPYIRSVRFQIELPGTVNIIVEESQVTYAVQDTLDGWWMITSEGKVVEQITEEKASSITRLPSLKLEKPTVGQMVVAAENADAQQPVATTNADRLAVALQVFQALEANEMLTKIASVDVSKPQQIEIWYGTQYRIKLGDSQNLEYKIAAAKQAMSQLSQYQAGVLDASFTAFQDKVTYLPFQE